MCATLVEQHLSKVDALLAGFSTKQQALLISVDRMVRDTLARIEHDLGRTRLPPEPSESPARH